MPLAGTAIRSACIAPRILRRLTLRIESVAHTADSHAAVQNERRAHFRSPADDGDLSAATKAFGVLILSRRLRHDGNPVMRWMVAKRGDRHRRQREHQAVEESAVTKRPTA